jgi:predicted ester cyclase
VTQREEHRSLYLSYLEYCNEHDFDRMASFYTSTIKVNDVPMDPAAVAAQFALLFSAFPDWHWEIRRLVVDGESAAIPVIANLQDVHRQGALHRPRRFGKPRVS